jgi:hypothetical protein
MKQEVKDLITIAKGNGLKIGSQKSKIIWKKWENY